MTLLLLCCLQGVDPRVGLPKIRSSWVERRAGDKVCTQMHYARQGIVTEEMAFVAAREDVEVEFVRSEVRWLSAPPTPPHTPPDRSPSR